MSTAAQDLLAECSEAAAVLRLRMPLSVSTHLGDMVSVYTQLVHAAREPLHFIPVTPAIQVMPLKYCLPPIPPSLHTLNIQ